MRLCSVFPFECPVSHRFVVGFAAICLGIHSVGSAPAGPEPPIATGFTLLDVTNNCGVLPLPAPFGMTIGANLADINGDGHIDIVVPTDAGQRLQVYRNLGDGNFVEIAQQIGLDSTRRMRATLLFDFDGDGRLDLVAASDCWGGGGCPSHDALRLYRQQPDGTFVDVTDGSGLGGMGYTNSGTHAGGIAAGDLTGNGYLDLVVCYWNGRIRVFANNDGDGTFTDISISGGFTTAAENAGFFWQPIIADFNNDGLMDLFVAIDFNPNRLYINNGDGTFTNRAALAGVGTSWNEMGVTVGDFDNDGRLDIYVTNIYQFISGTQRHSVLFRNTTPHAQVGGIPQFVEIANAAGVADTGWGWGTTFFDANNNTLLDLAAVNGRVGGIWANDPSVLFMNMGPDAPQRFMDVGTQVGFDDTFVSSTVVAGDLNRNGRLDLVQSNVTNGSEPGPLRVLMNQPTGGQQVDNWITVRPRMPHGGNRHAIGAIVRATITLVPAGDDDEPQTVTMMRLITAGTSMSGQEPAEAHFGLAAADTVDELSVLWPNGETTVLHDVQANQLIEVWSSLIVPCQQLDLTGSGVIDADDLGLLLGAFGTNDPAMDFDGSGTVDAPDLAVLLASFGQSCR